MAIENYPTGEECRYNGRPHPLVEALPWYGLVSKDYTENAKQRLNVRRACCELTEDGKRYSAKARARQKKIWDACRDDPLFFIALFCYLAEPREDEPIADIAPFVPWANQEPVIASIAHYWGRRHIVGDKSRAQGASWIMVCLLVWSFIFRPTSFLGVGSKDEETADDPSDPMSLGWKIDFTISMLPVWMRPSSYRCKMEQWRDRKKKTWKNPDNRSFIKAFSATAGIGRAGRFKVFFLDESAFFPKGDSEAVANLLETTNGLVMISTPHGMDNEHYERVTRPGRWLRVVLDWRDNPYHSQGLYTVRNGRLEFIDKVFDWQANYPEGYRHILDGRIRSPWFDKKWFEHNENALLVDQELNREYQGSMGRPFPQAALNRMKVHCRVPLHTGTLEFDYAYPEDWHEYKWLDGEAYKFDLWMPIQNGFLPDDEYYIGVDLSRGVGGELSSNSVISIWNSRREQVGELADNTIDPVEFAHLTVAVAYWLGRGLPTTVINWEIDGPGQEFGLTLKRLQYPRLWVRPVSEDDRRLQKKGQNFGYANKNRDRAIRPLKIAIVNESVTIRSESLLEECGQYIIGDDGKPMHPKMKTARDGSSKGISHGDRVIAAAMAIHALDDLLRGEKRRKSRAEAQMPDKLPYDSYAARMVRRADSLRQKQDSSCSW